MVDGLLIMANDHGIHDWSWEIQSFAALLPYLMGAISTAIERALVSIWWWSLKSWIYHYYSVCRYQVALATVAWLSHHWIANQLMVTGQNPTFEPGHCSYNFLPNTVCPYCTDGHTRNLWLFGCFDRFGFIAFFKCFKIHTDSNLVLETSLFQP